MRYLVLAPLVLAAAAPASPAPASTVPAAERRFSVGSFERVRVDGPFRVAIATGSPGARVSGAAAAIDRVDIHVDGTTLVVRTTRGRWEERPRVERDAPLLVTLSTPSLTTLNILAGAAVTVDRMKAPRIDLSIAGTGSLVANGIATDQLVATVIGSGAMTLAGKSGKVRLSTNGPGTIAARALLAGDVIVRLDGNGETAAAARYTATVTNVGLGRVTIVGQPKCFVKADAGGQVICGKE